MPHDAPATTMSVAAATTLSVAAAATAVPAAASGLAADHGHDHDHARGGLGIGINKDPWSWLTHFIGLLLAVAGSVFLWAKTPDQGPKQPLMLFYGISLMLMFSTSTLYHFFDIGNDGNRLLRKLDHCAIFLLIAGTWLPPAIHTLAGPWRTATLAAMLGFAAVGIVFKLVWIDAPRWLGTGIYVAMGWGALIPGYHMFGDITAEAAWWLFGGGLFYSFGAVIYAVKRPDPWPGVFGFHEVWHVFVIAGATCHYFLVLGYCDAPCAPL